MPDPDFHDQDLASWLEEAGRRRIVRKAGEPVAEAAPAAVSAPERGIYISHPRELVLFALAAVAYLPYFFADVYVQIYSMKSVLVFV
ncbi:MAG TPA: hypothetical protein VE935_19115 [Burkholderiales bacterium]|nr:hypothetical protein [Burkholderiales bacterium]